MSNDKDILILKKYKEFFKELTAEKMINSRKVCLKPEDKVIDAKFLMKKENIAGLPVVNDRMEVVNIVTMEDIILSYETGTIDKKIYDLGEKKVIRLRNNDSFDRVIDIMIKFGFRNYPVLDENGRLMGMLSVDNVLLTVMSKLTSLYFHDVRRKEVLDSPLSILVNEFEMESGFKYSIDNNEVNNAGEGSALLKQYLLGEGLNKKLVRNISIATYEAEVNVVIHGGGKGEIAAKVEEEMVMIQIRDTGPGIENVEKAMEPGFSTATEETRALGFGAGMGLPNIKRFADKLVITSEKGAGVHVEMLFWIKEDK